MSAPLFALYMAALVFGLIASYLVFRGGGRDAPTRVGAWFAVQGLWAGIAVAEPLVVDPLAITVLDWAAWLFLFIQPLVTLAFARDVADRRDALGEPWFAVLLAFPLFCLAWIPLEANLGLFRRSPVIDGGRFLYSYGPLAYASFAYAASLSITAAVLIARRVALPKEHGRTAYAVLSLAVILGSAAGVFAFTGEPGTVGYAMPILLLASIVAASTVLVFRGWKGLFPLTREEAFREMPEPVLIFNGANRLVDSNLSARYLLGLRGPSLGERESESLLRRFPGLAERMEGDVGSVEAGIEMNGVRKDFLVESSPLFRGDLRAGTLVVFHDETNTTRSSRALRTMRDRLEDLYRDQMHSLADEVERRRDAEDLLRNLNDELKNTQKEIMVTLSNIVENRAKETAKHAQRVAEYSYILAKAIGVDEERAKLIRDAAPLHDVGKIAIRDNILEKPGRLDDDEWLLMRTHPRVGWELLHGSKRTLLQKAAIIALEHHERWDGTGYPQGLKGEAISVEGRIVAMADVIDALYSRRGYKEPWEFDRISEYIRSQAGAHFDPSLVDAYDSCLPQILLVAAEYDDESRTPSMATQALRDAMASRK